MPQHVFIIGCKGIPAAYGGYETFVDKLTEYHEDRSDIMYHVACKNAKEPHIFYHGADCFSVKVPSVGKSQAVLYDIKALSACCKYIKSRHIEHAIVYVLACRIGPWFGHYHRVLKKLGATLYVNPDGHEWKRKKWNFFIRKYWKLSEHLSIKNSDLIVCDNGYIKQYINEEYKKYKPNTTFIAYGAEIVENIDEQTKEAYQKWLAKQGLTEHGYYLIVGRFVPENNFESVIREMMASGSEKKLCIIATVNNKLYSELSRKLRFEQDSRIQFVGTVYDQKLLYAIRKGSFAYIHGHEVGGTNPSLLESLGSAQLSLVFNVKFNAEVCQDAALYWDHTEGSLTKQIESADLLSQEEIVSYATRAKTRIREDYSWKRIASQYEEIFLK